MSPSIKAFLLLLAHGTALYVPLRAGVQLMNGANVQTTAAAADSHLTEDAARKASFEEAQLLGEQLATILTESCSSGEQMPTEAVSVLRTLVSSTVGARGWFVSLLTNPAFDAIFRPPIDEAVLDAIAASPDPNIRLMIMNVAMSTATELTHKANGNAELATASAMTRDRSRAILAALLAQGMPGLSDEVEKLFTAVQPWTVAEAPDAPLKPAADADEGWVKFTRKWGYNAEQREAIRVQVAEILIR